MLVTLSGLEGASKSTPAESLKTQIGLYADIRTARDFFLRAVTPPTTQVVHGAPEIEPPDRSMRRSHC